MVEYVKADNSEEFVCYVSGFNTVVYSTLNNAENDPKPVTVRSEFLHRERVETRSFCCLAGFNSAKDGEIPYTDPLLDACLQEGSENSDSGTFDFSGG